MSSVTSRCDSVTNTYKHGRIFKFFCKNVSNIFDAFYMVNRNRFVQDRFSNGIFSNGNVAETFGGGRFGPANTCIIVIEDLDRVVNGLKDQLSVCIMNEVFDAKQIFDTFICGINFSLGRAASGDTLAATDPV